MSRLSDGKRSLSRDEVREVDRRAIQDLGLPGIVLMENAGRGAADWLRESHIEGPVAVCAGRGNNGGDGFVIARHLDNHGIDVRVLLASDPKSQQGDAATNLNVLQASGSPKIESPGTDPQKWEQAIAGCAWIVDALLGTGVKGSVREPTASIIAAINASGIPVLAVDLPSGMDCDTGQPLGTCVRAAKTATFVARKRGFDVPAAAELTGEVRVIDIGVPRTLLTQFGIL